MNYSDKQFILEEKEQAYKLGYKHGRIIGHIMGFTLGVIACLILFFYLASRS